MKLTAILLTVFFLQVKADGLSQTITLSGKNVSLETVITAIKRQTGYIFFYTEDIWKHAKPVNIEVKGARIEKVLELVFKNQPLTYIIEDKTVIVSKKPGLAVQDQEVTGIKPPGEFKGKIITKEGEPLVSANLVNKRTGKGTITDANGQFVLRDVALTDVVIVTYAGYEAQVIRVSEFKDITLVMEPAINQLDQVVMQAYGQTTQRFNTGNIAKVTSEEISKQPVINPLQALQGRVAGLVVTQTSGYGSAPFKVELRGRNNLNDMFPSDPLYIIDGVPLTISDISGGSSYRYGSAGFLQNGISTPAGGQSPLFSINPSDIESIEVLKDADATAIYGSRGANGVILVTTKKGKVGKAKVSGRISQGVSSITRHWDMLNTEQYLEMRKEAFQNDNVTITQANAYDVLTWDNTRYTDWQKVLWSNTGKATEAQLDLSGGNNQIVYRIGTGYSRRSDITTFSGADERISLSTSFSFKSANQRLTAQFTNAYSFAKSNMIFLGGTNFALLPPNAPEILDSAGNLNYRGWKPADYPFANLYQPYTAKTKFLNSNLTLSYELTRGLTVRSSFGYNSSQVKQTKFTPIFSLDQTRPTPPTGSAVFGDNDITNWIIEPQIDYSNRIWKGNINVLVGATVQRNSTEGQSVTGSGYTSDLLIRTISNAPSKEASEFFGQYRYAAYFGRITYNLMNKYVLNLSARRDGSSRFGEGKQFGNFGAIGAAWIFTEESIFKNKIPFLSFGKIRGSYGTTGSDAVGDYQFLTRWSSLGTYPYANNSSLVPLQHANDQYHWPTNKKLEAAIDLGVLKDRVSVSVAWYRNRCNDQLISFPLALYTGFDVVTANSPANVENSGWEFMVSGKILNAKDLTWSISFNTGINRNKLLSYPNIEQSPYAGLFVVGEPLNMVRKLRYTGVDPQTGLYTYEDRNKDGNISTMTDSTDDRYIINTNPKFTGGLGTNFSYKGLALSLFFNIVKQNGQNALYALGGNPGFRRNISRYVFENRWRKPGDQAEFAKFTTKSDVSYSNFYNSDAVYTDASYIRLSNVSLSYSIPQKIIKRTGLQDVRFSLNAQNLFVITDYKGLDPETQNFGGMPLAKVITAGINFIF